MKRPLLHISAFVAVVLALIGVAIASCSGTPEYDRRLLHSDSIMEDHPDSALALLKTIKGSDLRNAADSALYGLLLTQASVKTDSPLPPDTLIGRALAFYRDADDPGRLMRSLFYDAYTHAGDKERSERSTTEAIEAYRIAKGSADPYWTAKCAELLADLNESSFTSEEAYRLYKEASEQYAIAGKRINSLYSAADMELAKSTINAPADTAGNLQSIARLDSISRIAADSLHDMHLLCNAQRTKAWIALRMQDTSVAGRTLDYMDSIGLWKYATDKSERMLYRANLAVQQNDPKLAEKFLIELDSCDSAVTDSLMSNFIHAAIAGQTGNYKDGMDYLYETIDKMRSATHKALKHSAVAAHKDYLSEMEEEQAAHNRRLVRMNAAILTVSGIVVALLVFLYAFSIKLKKAQRRKAEYEFMTLHEDFERLFGDRESIRQEAETVSSRLERSEHKIESLESDLHDIRKSNQKLSDDNKTLMTDLRTVYLQSHGEINALCEILLKNKSSLDPSHIMDGIIKSVGRYKKSNYRVVMEERVERVHGPIMKMMREQIGSLSEKELDFILHMLAGFNTSTVAVLLDISVSNVYVYKNRIRSKIAYSDAPDKAYFLEVIGFRNRGIER